jgi:hypothetical protein
MLTIIVSVFQLIINCLFIYTYLDFKVLQKKVKKYKDNMDTLYKNQNELSLMIKQLVKMIRDEKKKNKYIR